LRFGPDKAQYVVEHVTPSCLALQALGDVTNGYLYQSSWLPKQHFESPRV